MRSHGYGGVDIQRVCLDMGPLIPFFTDEELAELKRCGPLTIADWELLTPQQRLADIAEFWATLWALDHVINLMDPCDPMNRREREEQPDPMED